MRMGLWGYPLLAALAAAPIAAPAPSAPHEESRAASTPPAPRPDVAGAEPAADPRSAAPAPSEREREAALLLMLGDAAAHWRLR